jgi:uncharacterized protein with HEPN domain
MPSKDKLAVQGILESIRKIKQYTKSIKTAEELRKDELVIDACLINLVNIGEMVNRLSDEFIEAHSSIDWHKIRGLRNIIAHDYFGIDPEEIWSVIKIHIPKLSKYLKPLRF